MLQSTLSSIREILKQKTELNDQKIEDLLSLFSRYNKQDIIYPGVIIRKLNLTMQDSYHLLEEIRNDGYFQLNYEVYCFSCNQFTGEIYQTINHIPEEVYCENCGDELSPLDNIIAIYRVDHD